MASIEYSGVEAAPDSIPLAPNSTVPTAATSHFFIIVLIPTSSSNRIYPCKDIPASISHSMTGASIGKPSDRSITITRMKPHVLSRRQFLQSTAAAGTGTAVAQIAPRSLWSFATLEQNPDPVPTWAARPLRWFQLTLVEDDPAHFDLAFWLETFQRTRSEGVCLSGGGCVAYYPTEIPFHHRSAWLGDRDMLGELVSGCRQIGMSVLVRTDPHAT